MFEDYREAVLLFYREKQDSGVLSGNLSNPTPAQLKKECEIVHSERHSKQDETILRSFFGATDQEKDFPYLITKMDTDKFKPLHNVLKGKIKDPKANTIELLAWLTDFKPRPYSMWRKQQESVNQDSLSHTEDARIPQKEDLISKVENAHVHTANSPLSPLVSAHTVPSDPIAPIDKSRVSFSINKILPYFIMIIVVISATFWLSRDNQQQQCMYWADDHYEPIFCNKKVKDAVIFALDSLKVARLKKITRPDTLTAYSIHRVWYGKLNGKVEFFTDGGEHPMDAKRRLLPLSYYILDKYGRLPD